MQLTRDHIVRTAESYVGTRWHHQGRSTAGLDCIGLIVRVAQDCCVSVVDQTGYGRQPDGQRLRLGLEGGLERITEPEPGAVLLMRFENYPMHVAFCGHDNTMIHAYAASRKVVQHRVDETWVRRIVAVYRFPGLEGVA